MAYHAELVISRIDAQSSMFIIRKEFNISK
ncbi:hypothetical protein COLO4_37809 [Corchorus olitorius]|uniref:Uncharacterized protein n=1 Tax=Corchorus olitorius TaxID=93759 RepID=A0A1R3FZ60_9ROSI|nr:hypothetical protein COLO4_37809 [Corchorus olitorius]